MSSSKKDIINILNLWKNNFVNPSNWDEFKNKVNESVFRVLGRNNSFTKYKKKQRSNAPKFNDWISEIEGGNKIKLIHIYYWNLLDEIEKKGKLVLNLTKHQNIIVTNKLYTKNTLNKLTEKNKEMDRQNSVNSRMSQYYSGQIESSEGINKFIKYIFFILLSIIIIVFIAKKQYKNKKISFYIIFLYLVTYCFEPIMFYIRLNTEHFGEFFVNYFILYFLFILIGLFLGFKNFIFESDKNMKLYFHALSATIVISLLLIIYKFFSYSWTKQN